MRPIFKLLTLALAATASSPAIAKQDAWYIGVEGGTMYVPDIHYDIGGVEGRAVNNNYGWDVDGTIGYDFGGFRAEAEVGYRHAGLDILSYNVPTPFYTSTGAVGVSSSGTFSSAGGRTSALDFMVNGLIDVGKDDELQGFFGGGVGVARVSGRYGLTKYGYYLDDSDTVFAWQILAGLRAPLSDKLDVSFKYRFFNTARVDLLDIGGRGNEAKFKSHSILGGLTYNFGAPPPPPPPAPLDPGSRWAPITGPYIGIDAGLIKLPDIKIDIGGTADARAENKTGLDVGATFGYDFGRFRAEAEAAYKRAKMGGYASTTTTLRSGGLAPPGAYPGATGSTSALSFMVNGYLDFGSNNNKLSAFIGAGAGIARIEIPEFTLDHVVGFLDDKDTKFAWQALAGIRAPITDRIDVTFKYRFFNVPKVDMIDALGRQNRLSFRSHSLLAGLTYNFGAPPPPPPPPPPETGAPTDQVM